MEKVRVGWGKNLIMLIEWTYLFGTWEWFDQIQILENLVFPQGGCELQFFKKMVDAYYECPFMTIYFNVAYWSMYAFFVTLLDPSFHFGHQRLKHDTKKVHCFNFNTYVFYGKTYIFHLFISFSTFLCTTFELIS